MEKCELDFQEQEREVCTFRPELAAGSRELAGSSGRMLGPDPRPHYEKLYDLHMLKQNTLDRVRKEQFELEQKQRKFTSSNRKKSVPTVVGAKRAPGEAGEQRFVQLYKQDQVYKNRREELAQRIMREQGVSFVPNINNRSFNMIDDGVIERNEQFLRRKNQKIATQVGSQQKGCTFQPRVCAAATAGNVQKKPGDVCDRLYKYYERYEQRKKQLWDELHHS